MTRSRPLQSVEVLTTLGSRDLPYNRPAPGHLWQAPRGNLVPGCSKYSGTVAIGALTLVVNGVSKVGRGVNRPVTH